MQWSPAESGVKDCKRAFGMLLFQRIQSQVEGLNLTVVVVPCKSISGGPGSVMEVEGSALEDWIPAEDVKGEGEDKSFS